jgi:acyl carrier protein
MDVGEVVKGAILEVCGVDASEFVMSTRLADAGIDSLDLIEISMIVEERFNVHVEPERFEGVGTLGEAIAVFRQIVEV